VQNNQLHQQQYQFQQQRKWSQEKQLKQNEEEITKVNQVLEDARKNKPKNSDPFSDRNQHHNAAEDSDSDSDTPPQSPQQSFLDQPAPRQSFPKYEPKPSHPKREEFGKPPMSPQASEARGRGRSKQARGRGASRERVRSRGGRGRGRGRQDEKKQEMHRDDRSDRESGRNEYSHRDDYSNRRREDRREPARRQYYAEGRNRHPSRDVHRQRNENYRDYSVTSSSSSSPPQDDPPVRRVQRDRFSNRRDTDRRARASRISREEYDRRIRDDHRIRGHGERDYNSQSVLSARPPSVGPSIARSVLRDPSISQPGLGPGFDIDEEPEPGQRYQPGYGERNYNSASVASARPPSVGPSMARSVLRDPSISQPGLGPGFNSDEESEPRHHYQPKHRQR